MIETMKKHKWSILGIFLMSVFLMGIFLLNPYHENDDTVYHIANIVSLKDSMKLHGLFGSPILPNLAGGFGYASHLLYPPLSHTVSAFVYFFLGQWGVRVTDCLKFVHLLVFFLSGISMYEFAYKIHQDKKVAFFSSIIYLSLPYHLSEHYVRDAMGELFVFPFIPMILSGIVSLLEGDKKAFYPLFVIGYVGAMLSHFTIMIYFTILLAIFLLIYYKKVFRKEFIIPFFVASLSVLGLTLFFLEPLIEYKLHGHIAVFLEGVMSWGVYGTSLWPWEYLPLWNVRDEVSYGFSLVSFFLFVTTFLQYRKLKQPKYAKGFLIVTILCFFFSSKLFYFDLLPSLLYMIQFAWRLCTFLAIGIAIFAPLCIQKWDKKKLIVLLVFICGCALFEIHFRCDNEFIHSDEAVVKSGAAMGWQHEYLPENAFTHEEYYENRDAGILVKEGKDATILENKVPNLTFEAEKGSVLELPRLYYLGYVLQNEVGKKVELYENDMGFIEVEIPENGIYELTYPGTLGARIAKWISLISLIFCIIGYSWYLFSKKCLNSSKK